MKLTKQLRKIGNSVGILIDKPIMQKLKVKEKDWVEADIKKVGKGD